MRIIIDVVVSCVLILFFFLKQKTAYDFRFILVGSEMVIRDRGGWGVGVVAMVVVVVVAVAVVVGGVSGECAVSYAHLTLPTNREV